MCVYTHIHTHFARHVSYLHLAWLEHVAWYSNPKVCTRTQTLFRNILE